MIHNFTIFLLSELDNFYSALLYLKNVFFRSRVSVNGQCEESRMSRGMNCIGVIGQGEDEPSSRK